MTVPREPCPTCLGQGLLSVVPAIGPSYDARCPTCDGCGAIVMLAATAYDARVRDAATS